MSIHITILETIIVTNPYITKHNSNMLDFSTHETLNHKLRSISNKHITIITIQSTKLTTFSIHLHQTIEHMNTTIFHPFSSNSRIIASTKITTTRTLPIIFHPSFSNPTTLPFHIHFHQTLEHFHPKEFQPLHDDKMYPTQ
jgi:hypothetical protein